MDTTADTRDEQHQDIAGMRVWPAQEPGDEAGAMLGMPADLVCQIDTQPRRESDAWSWLEWLEPLGELLELLGALLELLAPFGQ